MKLKDKAVTCIHCGAWEVWTTDWRTSRLIVEASKPCTCSEPVREIPNRMTGTCLDCGAECRENAKRCWPCMNARDKHMRSTYEARRRAGQVRKHRNVYTPEIGAAMHERRLRGESLATIAKAYGLGDSTVSLWVIRYVRSGAVELVGAEG